MIPDPVRQFIRNSIKSVWALELLLFMRRGAPSAWSVNQLSAQLRSSPSLIAAILPTFKKTGLVTEEPIGFFRYDPVAPEIEDAARQLDEINAERPLALIKEIVAMPNEKLNSFVAAFNMRRGKD